MIVKSGKQHPDEKLQGAICVMLAGALIAGATDLTYSLPGYIWVTICAVSTAMYLLLIRALKDSTGMLMHAMLTCMLFSHACCSHIVHTLCFASPNHQLSQELSLSCTMVWRWCSVCKAVQLSIHNYNTTSTVHLCDKY